jgi:hypothetical protein
VAALNVLPQPRAGTLREVFAYDRANVKMLATGRVAAMRRSLFGGSRLPDRGTGALGAGACQAGLDRQAVAAAPPLGNQVRMNKNRLNLICGHIGDSGTSRTPLGVTSRRHRAEPPMRRVGNAAAAAPRPLQP